MTTTPERVTIVVRTRDRASFLARALDDVLGQTFADWRIVLVNDGGDPVPVDAAVDARRDRLADRVRVMHVPDGTGSMEAAANLGAEAGSGEFVVVHDDDDTWHPEFLARTVAALEADAGAVAVAVRTDIVYEKQLDDGRLVETRRKAFDAPAGMVTLFDLLLANRVVPISLLVRRSTFDAIGWYDPALLAVGDWEFMLRLVRAGRVPYLRDAVLAHWHQRPRAKGAASNSIFGGEDRHAQFDRLVRERALLEYANRDGIGALLYLTKYIDERLYYYSMVGTIRRIFRRLGGRR